MYPSFNYIECDLHLLNPKTHSIHPSPHSIVSPIHPSHPIPSHPIIAHSIPCPIATHRAHPVLPHGTSRARATFGGRNITRFALLPTPLSFALSPPLSR